MARDIRTDVESLRAADSDRQKVAEQLKEALEEGRLTLHEYDERLQEAYASRTYKDLLVLVSDLPRPGLSTAEVNQRRVAEARRRARRMPPALIVLWTVWGAIAAVNVVVYLLVSATVETESMLYPWPIWLLVPATALAAATVGTKMYRDHQRM